MRTCSKCKLEKDNCEFTKNSHYKSGLNHSCKKCHNEYTRSHYLRNKSKYKARARSRETKLRGVIDQLKNKPCMDCKAKFNPWQMDFDHVKGVKKFGIATISNGLVSMKSLMEEIDKCDLVCANCHRQRTHERLISRKKSNEPTKLICDSSTLS